MFIGAFLGFFAYSVVSDQGRMAEARYAEALETQCAENLGFSKSSADYINCVSLYQRLFVAYDWEIPPNNLSIFSAMERKIEQLNNTCGWEEGMPTVGQRQVWECIYLQGSVEMTQIEKQREREWQEESLVRALDRANEENRLQIRIDRERERVAYEKGKKIEKVRCYTTTKSNGYVKVKCK